MGIFSGPEVHLSPLRKRFAPPSWKNAMRSPTRPKPGATLSTSPNRSDPSMTVCRQYEWSSKGSV